MKVLLAWETGTITLRTKAINDRIELQIIKGLDLPLFLLIFPSFPNDIAIILNFDTQSNSDYEEKI